MNVIEKDELAKQFELKIIKLSKRMISNREIAMEASQEVWFEILKNIEGFKGESEISTWVYTIARRTILKYSNNEMILTGKQINSHFNLDQIAYVGNDEDKNQWIKEKCDYCLTAFCHCLTSEARLIFLFRYISKLSISQISTIMELEEENIRKISSRSKLKVQKFMEKDCILYNPTGNCRCRIRKEILSIELDKEYGKLSIAADLIDFMIKFDKKIPEKCYWENIII